jgi:lipopolysaccharide biosynthesis protein
MSITIHPAKSASLYDLHLRSGRASQEDDLRHIRWLAQVFQDSRYIRVNDKPLFLVYRASQLPNPQKTTEVWRQEAHRLGIGDLYLCKVESFATEHTDPSGIGFDAAVEFQPDCTRMGVPLQTGRKRNLTEPFWDLARTFRCAEQAYGDNSIYDYLTIVEQMLAKPESDYLRFPCVTPSWDNTARRKKGATILQNATPVAYEYWLKTILQRSLAKSSQEPLVFINGWNEWAEGNHLEPCQKWGHAYLEATARALHETTLHINV